MNKEKRHEVYKLALNNNEGINHGIVCDVGLCWLLRQYQLDTYNNWHADEYEDAKIPELWLFVEGAFISFGGTTVAEKWEVRKIILEFCIEMTR